MGKKRIRVTASRHSYHNAPMRLPLDGIRQDVLALRDVKTGAEYSAQVSQESGRPFLCWILDDLAKGQSREFETVSKGEPSVTGVELVESEGKMEFRVGGELFTAYHYGSDVARPYLYPVIGPGGASVTRHYPMETGTPGESKDHEHHRSIWVAHGDVNGADDWSEMPGHARVVHRKLVEKTSGPVFARVTVLNDWMSADGKKLIEEERAITAYHLPADARLLDVGIVFRATEGDVKFGDTKEGGIMSVRVATSMDGDKGGLITNSFGGVTEAECWGKRAHWCDYTGPVEGRTVGITVFDDPCNFRHPTYWHVRDYGLMTSNPFGLSEYYHDRSIDGSHVVKSGSSFPFSYRILIHDGDAEQANVAEIYHGYINPPTTEVR